MGQRRVPGQLELAGVEELRHARAAHPAAAFVDVIYRAYNRDTARTMSPANVRSIRIQVRDIRNIDDILEAAYRAGAPKGSSRSGIFEVQTDDGIWMRDDGAKFNLATKTGRAAVRFRTWDELEGADR